MPFLHSLQSRWHLLAAALTLAFLLFRLSDVGSNPKGFFCDEASIGYNAYCVLETGKDEHGVRWPLFFRAFGDYKPGLYIYLTTLSVRLFGLTHFAVRLPAAVLLGLVLPVVYLILARRVHPAGAIVGLLVAGCAPWLHHFSHIAFSLSAIP